MLSILIFYPPAKGRGYIYSFIHVHPSVCLSIQSITNRWTEANEAYTKYVSHNNVMHVILQIKMGNRDNSERNDSTERLQHMF